MQAGCQKLHPGYELHWKMGCHCDPHIEKKEDQFQKQSLSEESLFCCYLSLFWTTPTFTSETQDRFDGPCESECKSYSICLFWTQSVIPLHSSAQSVRPTASGRFREFSFVSSLYLSQSGWGEQWLVKRIPVHRRKFRANCFCPYRWIMVPFLLKARANVKNILVIISSHCSG